MMKLDHRFETRAATEPSDAVLPSRSTGRQRDDSLLPGFQKPVRVSWRTSLQMLRKPEFYIALLIGPPLMVSVLVARGVMAIKSLRGRTICRTRENPLQEGDEGTGIDRFATNDVK